MGVEAKSGFEVRRRRGARRGEERRIEIGTWIG